MGNEISVLQDEELSEGSYNFTFNADEFNLSSGIYIYQALFNNQVRSIRKAVFLK